LRQTLEVLIPSSNVNTTPEYGIFFMIGFLRFFRHFPQINVGGDSAHFPPLEDTPVSLASLARKRVGCDSWLLVNQLVLFLLIS